MKSPADTLDDSYQSTKIGSFDGGVITAVGPLELGANQSPAILNLVHLPGKLLFRGGCISICGLAAGADQAASFTDAAGSVHIVVWNNGSLYDCTTGVAILVETAYTAGQNVGWVAISGVLYWSSNQPNPVPIRFWAPVAGTFGQLAGNLVPAGAVNPPASDYLFTYGGAIVALSPTWGAPAVANVYQPNVYAWSNVNAVNTWIGNNSQAVGQRNGAHLEAALQFGIGAEGVTPYEAILVFRSDVGVFAYSGALGSQTEAVLSCPAGLKDRFSLVYLPTKGQRGAMVWLSNDGQFWKTDGVNALPISTEQILPTLAQSYYNAIQVPGTRFCGGYDNTYQYYYCDVGGVEFVWRWVTESWTLFNGRPRGISVPSLAGPGTNTPANYVASNVAPFRLSLIAQMGQSDYGVMPTIYWKSPILHGGDWARFKKFHKALIAVLDTGAIYNVSATSIRRQDGNLQTSKLLSFTAPNTANPLANPFKLDSSLLGGPNILSDPIITALNPGTPVILQGPLMVPIPQSEWWPAGHVNVMEGNGVQLTISYGGGTNAFDLLGAEILFIPQGYRRGSGSIYNPNDLGGQLGFDPYWPIPRS